MDVYTETRNHRKTLRKTQKQPAENQKSTNIEI